MIEPHALNDAPPPATAALSRRNASAEMDRSPLALGRLGLRFRDAAAEADYQDWRIGESIPFVRVGMVASAIIWLGVAGSAHFSVPEMFHRIALLVFFPMLPLVLAAFGVTFVPRLRTAVMPVTALVNCIAGLMAIWLVHELFAVPAAAPASFIMVAYFALTIFRLPPTLALGSSILFVSTIIVIFSEILRRRGLAPARGTEL